MRQQQRKRFHIIHYSPVIVRIKSSFYSSPITTIHDSHLSLPLTNGANIHDIRKFSCITIAESITMHTIILQWMMRIMKRNFLILRLFEVKLLVIAVVRILGK